ncbi:MAG: SagB/ThcOx family dehydrogenase [Bacteroidota bacterium]|nr:SagB/ThcOx family dehydrogenase [Bacteroidota bacterium]
MFKGIISLLLVYLLINENGMNKIMDTESVIPLSKPQTTGKVSLEETLNKRRTIRSFSNKPISVAELSQLLWAGQGITSPKGFRTAPSAGALYPLEIFVVAGNVGGLESGIYRYKPQNHSLTKIISGDKRKDLADAALGQDQIETAAANIIIAAVVKRTSSKYGARAERYVNMEVGHAAQNILLQVQSLGLGACPIGAFYDEKVKKFLQLNEEEPLYILTIGK